QALDAFPRFSGCNQHWHVIKKENALPRFLDQIADRFSFATLWPNEVPLIQNHKRSLARFLNQTGDAFVLRGHAARKIDNQYAEIRATNTSLRAHDAKNFDRARKFSASAHSGGVDKEKFFSVTFVSDVDRITRGSGQFADNRALALHDCVDERRFADIRATNDGNCHRLNGGPSRTGTC